MRHRDKKSVHQVIFFPFPSKIIPLRLRISHKLRTIFFLRDHFNTFSLLPFIFLDATRPFNKSISPRSFCIVFWQKIFNYTLFGPYVINFEVWFSACHLLPSRKVPFFFQTINSVFMQDGSSSSGKDHVFLVNEKTFSME